MAIEKKRFNTADASLPMILLGAGGHAKVVAQLAKAAGRYLMGVCDPALAAAGIQVWRGLTVLGDDEVLVHFTPDKFGLAMGIGAIPGSRLRAERYDALIAMGYSFPPLVHPSVLMDESTTVEDGAQIMAGVIVQPDCWIGENTIINTRAVIDHEVHIGSHAHIAPGAVVCGGARVGSEAFIGASATLLPLVVVGERCLVAAGSTLARPLADGESYCPHRYLTAATAAQPSSD